MEKPGYDIRSYVIRSGRMTDSQRSAYSTLSAKYCVEFDPRKNLEPRALFGNGNPLIIEIGFGMGFATTLIAENMKGMNFLGIEVHKPGIGKLLSEIEKRRITNLRIMEHDAVESIRLMVPDSSVHGVHVFFPDPWPKKRHHKRRLFKAEFIALLSRKLQKGGYIYFITDWEEYAAEALGALSACAELKNPFESFAPRREWRPVTKFEMRAGREGRAIRELYFERT